MNACESYWIVDTKQSMKKETSLICVSTVSEDRELWEDPFHHSK